jgi:hypothetical protein
MSPATPIYFLVLLGSIIAVLGLFAAGSLVMVGLGLLAVFGAGVLAVAAKRA